MLIYSQYKYWNYMEYPYMLKQYDFVNEMHSLGKENWEHIIVLVYMYLIVRQVDPTSKHMHEKANLMKYAQQYSKIYNIYQIHLN